MTTLLSGANLENSTAVTPTPGDNSTKIATTAFVDNALSSAFETVTQTANLAGSRGLYATPNPDSTPPSAPDIFQNTSGLPMLVTVSADGGGGGFHGVVYCDSSSSPSTQTAQFGRVNSGSSSPNFYPASVTFLVPPNYYYGISVTSGGGSPSIRTWTEWTFGV